MSLATHIVDSRPHRWRVMEGGDGPALLLLHGAGATADSWGDVAPLLTERFRVIAVDLPGHGATRLGARTRSGLAPMAEDLGRLMEALEARPALIVGHSAGAAVALRMAEMGAAPRVMGFNAALAQFPGLAGVLFPALAHILSLSPGAGDLIAMAAGRRSSTRRLLESTGGPVTEAMVERYHRLITDAGHVKATLAMMAQWRIEPLRRALAKIDAKTRFVIGGADATVPPATSREAAAMMPDADLVERDDLGHLAHEQDPEWAAEVIADFAGAVGVNAPPTDRGAVS